MEWSKIKTILIVALVLTNLIIGYFLVQEWRLEAKVNIDQLKDMQEILLNNHIDSYAVEPIQLVDMPVLYASFHKFELDEIAPKLLNANHVKQINVYRDENYELELKDSTTLYLNARRPKVDMGKGKMTDVELNLFVEKWILDKFDAKADFKLINSVSTPEGLLLSYGQYYQEFFIDGSYMNVLVTDDVITRFERKWFDLEVKAEERIKIVPYALALYRLMYEVYMPTEVVDQVTLESVDLGYRLEGNIFDADILAGEASPYLKFKTKEGTTYLVEALWTE